VVVMAIGAIATAPLLSSEPSDLESNRPNAYCSTKTGAIDAGVSKKIWLLPKNKRSFKSFFAITASEVTFIYKDVDYNYNLNGLH
jgi:hypothetical protein